MSAGVGSSARKLIPKKLEEDLNIPRYKVTQPSKNIKGVFDDSKEKAMYDEMFGGLLNQNRDRPSYLKPSMSVNSSRNDLLGVRDEKSTSHSTDNSIIYIKRLEQAESELKMLRSSLAKSSLANDELTIENKRLKARLELFDCNGDMRDENRMLRNENDALQEELTNLHNFLADYGLEWVGPEAAEVAADSYKDKEENNTITKEGLEHSQKIFKKLVLKVKGMNDQLRSEPAVVKTTDTSEGGIRRARLVHGAEGKETMKCTFYYNGLLVNRGPFRYNYSPSYVAFVNDLLDGYFPSEYKELYPDGVLFDLFDKHDVLFQEGVSSSAGLTSDDLSMQMKGSQLLNKLPKVVVKNGQIVNIRDEISQRFESAGDDAGQQAADPKSGGAAANSAKGTSRQLIVLDSPASVCADGVSDIATVQIRFTGVAGSRVSLLQIRMFSFDKIQALAELVCKFHNESVESKGNGNVVPSQLELRTTYPARKLKLDESFDEAGLVPNGNLNVKII